MSTSRHTKICKWEMGRVPSQRKPDTTKCRSLLPLSPVESVRFGRASIQSSSLIALVWGDKLRFDGISGHMRTQYAMTAFNPDNADKRYVHLM